MSFQNSNPTWQWFSNYYQHHFFQYSLNLCWEQHILPTPPPATLNDAHIHMYMTFYKHLLDGGSKTIVAKLLKGVFQTNWVGNYRTIIPSKPHFQYPNFVGKVT